MLGCKSVRAQLSALHDHELSGWYARYVDLHSSICPPCKRTRRSMDQMLTLLHGMRPKDSLDGESARSGSTDEGDHESR